MPDIKRLIIIGNGMVGFEFCRQLVHLRLNETYRITIFGAEPHPAYDRIRLTECMSGAEPESLLLTPRDWYPEMGIELVTSTRVVHIAPTSKCIQLDNGETHPYDKLALATGSSPYLPEVEGIDAPGILVYRDVADVLQIREAAARSQCTALIGGGLLGLELARAIREHGVETHVIEYTPGLMLRQLNEDASQLLQREMDKRGIATHVATSTRRIERTTEGYRLHFAPEGALDCDTVIVTAGIRPRGELAREAGLACDLRGGVIIDDHTATSDPDIFAIGECVSHRGICYGLAAPGYKMAEVLARQLAGDTTAAFEGTDFSTRLKLPGLEVQVIGDYQAEGHRTTYRWGTTYRQLITMNNALIGATIIGDCAELPRIQDAVLRQVHFSDAQLQFFEKYGDLFGDDSNNVVNWPDKALVCSCMHVTRGQLGEAIENGCSTVDALIAATRACTVCGSCRPLLASLTGEEAGHAPRLKGSRAVAASSIAAFILGLVFFFTTIPYATRIESGWSFDELWRDPLIKQVTGYSLIGLSLLTVLLSLRKRLRWFSRSNFGWWRMLHTCAGLFAVVILIAHTGMNLGFNLNRWLMVSFLALCLLGGLAGVLCTIENEIKTAIIRAVRALSIRLHILLLCLLVPLLIFHIVSVYYY